VEVEEVLENLTESLRLVWSFETVALQISSEKTSLSFVPFTEALQYFFYTRRPVFFSSSPFHVEILKEMSSVQVYKKIQRTKSQRPYC